MTLPLFQQQLTTPILIEKPVDILYLTGLNVSTGQLFAAPDTAMLVLDGRYFENAKKKAPCDVVLAGQETFDFPVIEFDGAFTTVERAAELALKYPAVKWVNRPNPLKELRSLKSADEIAHLEIAATLCALGYDHVVSLLKEGMTESEAALELDFFWKKRGGQGFSFDPIIAFGANSSMPHYRAGITPLKKGDTVLIDIGVMVNNYHSDMTRTIFFGEPQPEMRKIYNIVREAQTRALDAVKPGVHAGELDKAARGYIEAEGYGPQFSHSLGHGVGLEIHEWPFLRNRVPMADIPIKEGMCLTVEPGIYIEGLGGVRIEDSIIVTQEGYRSLTNRPTELSVLPC